MPQNQARASFLASSFPMTLNTPTKNAHVKRSKCDKTNKQTNQTTCLMARIQML